MTLYIQPYQFRRMARRWAEQSQQPQYRVLGVNVSEQDDAYVLSALVPGLKAEDLNIQVLENVVSIEGEYQAADTSLTLAAGASGTVTVTMSAEKGALAGDHQATLTISSGGSEVAHAAVYTFVK